MTIHDECTPDDRDSTHPRRVLVVGGGIAGMCAAIMLARSGREVELAEADTHWRALGAGMTLNGGALRAFGAMGLLDAVKEEGWCRSKPVVWRADGSVLFAAGDEDSPFGAVPMVGGIMRSAMHKVLQEACHDAGVRVSLGRAFANLVQDDRHVGVTFADGTTGDYDFVVGADGFGSAVREALFPGAKPFSYVGMGCWRAVVPRPADVLGPITINDAETVGVNPVSEKQMYLFWNEHSVKNRRIPEDQWLDYLRVGLSRFAAPLIRNVATELDEGAMINYRPIEGGMLPGPWHRGRVLLIGDAVHVPTPHSAYGAGLGIEDAIVLAEELDTGPNLAAALDRYMERRLERSRTVVECSIAIATAKIRGAEGMESANASRQLTQTIIRPY